MTFTTFVTLTLSVVSILVALVISADYVRIRLKLHMLNTLFRDLANEVDDLKFKFIEPARATQALQTTLIKEISSDVKRLEAYRAHHAKRLNKIEDIQELLYMELGHTAKMPTVHIEESIQTMVITDAAQDQVRAQARELPLDLKL